MSAKYLNLENVTLEDNTNGIYNKIGTRSLNLQDVTLRDNAKGIFSYSPNISVNNCLIIGGSHAIVMSAYSYQQTLSVTHSEIFYCKLVVELTRSNAVVVLHGSTLQGNVMISKGYGPNHLNVSGCSISETRGVGFSVDAYQSGVKLSFNNNIFFKNKHTIFLIKMRSFESTLSTVRINKNVFVNNSLSSGDALIDFFGNGFGTIFTNIHKNTFTGNKCSFLIKVNIRSNRLRSGIFSFKNNILENNEGIPSNVKEYVEVDVNSYSLGILGCISKQYNIHHNVFDNKLMEKELFLGLSCGSNYFPENYFVSARFNYWGTSSTIKLRERIFHFANWNDRPSAKYLPAATSRNFSDFITSEVTFNQNQIGGYISSSLRLSMACSPYVVMNDLTVSENATLEIEPGVQIYFKPNIGLLVLGNINAQGTTSEKIKLCSLERKCKHKPIIRLAGGDRQNRGKLEILVGGRWLFLCDSNYFTSRDGSVACRQLGYGRYIDHKREYYGNTAPHHKAYFGCQGNETSLFDCNNKTVNYCGWGIYLKCERDYRWGNLRIVSPKKANTSYYYHRNEHSSLRDIVIHGAGYLHGHDVSSLQIIERSLSITSIHIVESNGIEIIGQKHAMALEHVSIEKSLKFPAIVILGNKGSISISQATIVGGNQHGIAIAPIDNMTFFQPYLGQHNLCDPVQKIFVDGQSYVFLNQRSNIKGISCAVEIQSPNNTMINFRLLSWVPSSYSVSIHPGGRSSQDTHLGERTIRKDILISSNSLTIEATITILKGFLAEITVIGQTGKKT